jgi:hypothetical protein
MPLTPVRPPLRIRWNRFAAAVIFWIIVLAIVHALLDDSRVILLDNIAVGVVGAATDTLVVLWRHRPLDRVAQMQAITLGVGMLVFWGGVMWLERRSPDSESWVVAGGVGVAIGSLPFLAIWRWLQLRRGRA